MTKLDKVEKGSKMNKPHIYVFLNNHLGGHLLLFSMFQSTFFTLAFLCFFFRISSLPSETTFLKEKKPF